MRIARIILRAAENVRELVDPLDQFVREVTAILNGGLRLDNVACEVKRVVYTGGESLSIATRYTSQPLSVQVLSAKPSQTEGPIQSGNTVVWTYASGFVTVGNIDGLNSATDYVVTLAIVEA